MNVINYIIPELFISISIMGLLMIGVFKKNSENEFQLHKQQKLIRL